MVADGAAAIGYEDIKRMAPRALDRAPMWVLFKTIEVIEGRSGPKKAALADQIARSSTPELIISAGTPERDWGKLYDRAGGEPHRPSGTCPTHTTRPRCASTRRPTSSASCHSYDTEPLEAPTRIELV